MKDFSVFLVVAIATIFILLAATVAGNMKQEKHSDNVPKTGRTPRIIFLFSE